jgi:hypothetical protein
MMGQSVIELEIYEGSLAAFRLHFFGRLALIVGGDKLLDEDGAGVAYVIGDDFGIVEEDDDDGGAAEFSIDITIKEGLIDPEK